MTKRIPLFRDLVIELQSNCNRDCWFCPRYSDDSGHRKQDGKHVMKHMSNRTVIDLLCQVKDMGYRGQVTFHHLSEPFLDDRLLGMAKLAKNMGMKPYVHTNGDVLRKDDTLADHATKIFFHIVVGLYDHETTEEREQTKAYWRNRLGPNVGFSSVDDVYVRCHHTNRNFDAFETRRGRRPVPRAFPGQPCHSTVYRCVIHYSGNLALCCEDMKEQTDLGSVLDTGLEELWYSDRHTEIALDLRAGEREKYEPCSTCPIPPFAYDWETRAFVK